MARRKMIKIFPRRIFGKLLAIRVNHPDFAVIEVDLVIVVNQTHVIRAMSESITDDHIHIVFVLENDIIKVA